MAKEREKREAVPRTKDGGGFWRSGRDGALHSHAKEVLTTLKTKTTRPEMSTRNNVTMGMTGSSQGSVSPPPLPPRPTRSGDGEKENKPSPEHPPRRIADSPPEWNSGHSWAGPEESNFPEEQPFHILPPDDPLLANLTVRPEDFGAAPSPPPAGSLLDGDVDEEANRRAFQEALMAWRGGGSTKSSLAAVGPNSHSTGVSVVEGKVMDVQTEPVQKKVVEVRLTRAFRPGGRAPENSYFNKLLQQKRPESAT
eukprot:tig00001333_g8198.t2